MKSFKTVGLFVVSFLLVFSSCSIDKKMYSSGYHVEWYKNAEASRKQKTRIAAKIPKQKTLPNNSLKTSKTVITKGENKIFNSQLSSKNLISREEIVRTKINFFVRRTPLEKKILPIDSLKIAAQKNKFSQNSDAKKWTKLHTLSKISVWLAILFLFSIFLLYTSLPAIGEVFRIFLPISAGVFFILGAILGSISSSHIKKTPLSKEETLKKEKKSKRADTTIVIVGFLIIFLVAFAVVLFLFYSLLAMI